LRKRNAFVTTETELKAIAAPAIIGSNNQPKTGYNTPAAMGMALSASCGKLYIMLQKSERGV
jgi:hypothetical protein